ncbi:MAG: hypothetical protein F4W95_13315 [Chloroflexi bacterium]|nr:hypothetical protein [Chloroflexota bacterium]MYD49444.1 hypothetical protein [Chloroflexota bacterium]
MAKAFNIDEFFNSLGDELIAAFTQGGLATTPGSIGRIRERAVRNKLRQLLPSGIGVGSGFVIDTQGNTSNQIDIILYEDNICPAFALDEDEETSYYPCEGVIAVGEVKSTIGTREVDDIIEKIASVKKLQRWCRPTDDGLGLGPTVPYRSYGSLIAFSGTEEEQYEQNKGGLYQIWGFGIASAMSVNENTMIAKLNAFAEKEGAAYCPNLIITTSGICVAPCKHDFGNSRESIVWSAIEGNGHLCIKDTKPLASLAANVIKAFRMGRTVDTEAFDQYIPNLKRFEILTGASFPNQEGTWSYVVATERQERKR